MRKIKTFADLIKHKNKLQKNLDLQFESKVINKPIQIRVAMATCGIASGAKKTMNLFSEALKKRGINAIITQTGCMGYCYAEPTVEITIPGKEPVVFGDVNKKTADKIIEEYIKKEQFVNGVIPITYKTTDCIVTNN